MTDESSEPVEYAPVDTLLGLLERGRGAGWLWVKEDREAGAGAEAVLDCLRRETRYDRQCDARNDYHALLVRELALPIDLLRQQLDGADEDDHDRAREILAALALTGSVEAREVLRPVCAERAVVAGRAGHSRRAVARALVGRSRRGRDGPARRGRARLPE
ncbi:hypothetical protein [Kitasatospora griseola]